MPKIKKNIVDIKTSATLAINELSQLLEDKGEEIYKFGLGQSPFPVPQIIVEELKNNSQQKNYINVSGLIELRNLVAQYHTINNKSNYTADNVIIGPGSKELIFQTQLVLDCEVLLPSPSWVSYEPQAQILNKEIHWIETDATTNWHITPEALDKKCKKLPQVDKLLIFNSPNNPSGTIHNNLEELAIVAKKNNVTVLSDEIYAELDFSGQYKSMSHYYPEGTIISSGLSKWCGAGGWRIGSLTFPQELKHIKNMIRRVASETYTSVSAPIQYAAIKAYSEDHTQYLFNSRKILEIIANYIHNELTEVGIKCQKPQGGFYMLCDFSNALKQSNEISDGKSLCNKILSEVGFAMLPGSDFGIRNELLISRIAFVDFDGSKALNLIEKNSKTIDDFLQIACPKIIRGIKNLKKWIKNN